MRDLRLFAILDDEKAEHLAVSAIHDPSGFKRLREALARQYDLSSREPDIQVWNVNLRGDRSLTLRHTRHNNRPLHDNAQEVLKHVARLWGFGVQLDSVDASGAVQQQLTVPAPAPRGELRPRRSTKRASPWPMAARRWPEGSGQCVGAGTDNVCWLVPEASTLSRCTPKPHSRATCFSTSCAPS